MQTNPENPSPPRELPAFPGETLPEEKTPTSTETSDTPKDTAKTKATEFTVTSEEMERELGALKQELAEVRALSSRGDKGGV